MRSRVRKIGAGHCASADGSVFFPFDDTALADFIRDKEGTRVPQPPFYCVNEVPHLSCIVHYQDAVVPQAVQDAAREIPARARQGSGSRAFERKRGAPDPCEGLGPGERALFNHLREWRSKQAHEDGVPPYVICTNKELVAIVRQRPEPPTALGHIEGIGPGKVERYGQALLKALNGSGSAKVQAPEPEPAEAASSHPAREPAPENGVEPAPGPELGPAAEAPARESAGAEVEAAREAAMEVAT